MIRKLGRTGIGAVTELGQLTVFTVQSLVGIFGQRYRAEKLIRAIYEIGVRCVPIILIVGLFTGLVLGLQLYYVLSRFSSETLLGQAVALTTILEIGPVFTAIMIVGQAGSALSAELGIQRNAEQIDALGTMKIQSLGFLVSPRLWAAIICFPILTAFFDWVAILGGHLTGVELLGVDAGAYWNRLYDEVTFTHVRDGYIKALAFGFLTTAVCSFNGYFTHKLSDVPGARGVSQTTTRAVVYSSIVILAADYVITSFLLPT
jgi:phospholipid/cholesterol/gamma-HCH transport system permease protein